MVFLVFLCSFRPQPNPFQLLLGHSGTSRLPSVPLSSPGVPGLRKTQLPTAGPCFTLSAGAACRHAWASGAPARRHQGSLTCRHQTSSRCSLTRLAPSGHLNPGCPDRPSQSSPANPIPLKESIPNWTWGMQPGQHPSPCLGPGWLVPLSVARRKPGLPGRGSWWGWGSRNRHLWRGSSAGDAAARARQVVFLLPVSSWPAPRSAEAEKQLGTAGAVECVLVTETAGKTKKKLSNNILVLESQCITFSGQDMQQKSFHSHMS